MINCKILTKKRNNAEYHSDQVDYKLTPFLCAKQIYPFKSMPGLEQVNKKSN